EPYLSVQKRLEWPKGAARQVVDLTLPRGVEVRGKVTEAASGKGCGQVKVSYFPQGDNETARKHQLLLGSYWPARTAADGSYPLVVPPGAGHLLVDPQDPDFIVRQTSRDEVQTGKPGGPTRFHHAVVPLNPAIKDGPKDLEIKLRRGVTLRGTVLGPDRE